MELDRCGGATCAGYGTVTCVASSVAASLTVRAALGDGEEAAGEVELRATTHSRDEGPEPPALGRLCVEHPSVNTASSSPRTCTCVEHSAREQHLDVELPRRPLGDGEEAAGEVELRAVAQAGDGVRA